MKTLLKPMGVVIHHSLTKDGKTCDWDGIKKYHMTAPEYLMDDIGYHGGVEVFAGKVFTMTGRPINKEGGHTKGHNDMLGLCIIGNFDLAEPSEEMLQAGATMVRAWLSMYPHLTPEDVHMHREYANYKSCPGTQFPWERFMALVRGE